jgi:hypothetical protein
MGPTIASGSSTRIVIATDRPGKFNTSGIPM